MLRRRGSFFSAEGVRPLTPVLVWGQVGREVYSPDFMCRALSRRGVATIAGHGTCTFALSSSRVSSRLAGLSRYDGLTSWWAVYKESRLEGLRASPRCLPWVSTLWQSSLLLQNGAGGTSR